MHYPMKTDPKTVYRRSDRGGWEYSDDGGTNWYLTQRTTQEVQTLCNVPQDVQDTNRLDVWGDTLDEPLPEDLTAYLDSI